MTNAQSEGWKAVGDFIRAQRQLANLSLRQLAQLAHVSNPYLSQIERGMYAQLAQVLDEDAESLARSKRRFGWTLRCRRSRKRR
jgi:transcriptional regulator with XRE-family HTH domain